jgi:16S rRNA (guanine527-N7)-methyltransferase
MRPKVPRTGGKGAQAVAERARRVSGSASGGSQGPASLRDHAARHRDTGRDRLRDTLGVSRETLERLEAFAAELQRWNPVVNLVSRDSLSALWTRHILDSAQLLALAHAGAREWRDIGTGGGFPGLVIAILAADMRPDLRVTLVEADRRKGAFLAAASRAACVTPCILIDRESALPVSPTDILSARALAPLPTLLGWGYRHLRPSGRALFHKGVGHRREIDAALATWQFRVQKHASLSGDGTILEIDRLKPAGPPIGAGPMD